MQKRSAGLLMYRRKSGLEVFLVHPGGPFWAKKDVGAWSIPKGQLGPGEPPLEAAKREFQEETGLSATGIFLELGSIVQASGKLVQAWALEGDCDPDQIVSNDCEVEWPPRSGQLITVPEVDRGAWFSIEDAIAHILRSQAPFVERLAARLRNQ